MRNQWNGPSRGTKGNASRCNAIRRFSQNHCEFLPSHNRNGRISNSLCHATDSYCIEQKPRLIYSLTLASKWKLVVSLAALMCGRPIFWISLCFGTSTNCKGRDKLIGASLLSGAHFVDSDDVEITNERFRVARASVRMIFATLHGTTNEENWKVSRSTGENEHCQNAKRKTIETLSLMKSIMQQRSGLQMSHLFCVLADCRCFYPRFYCLADLHFPSSVTRVCANCSPNFSLVWSSFPTLFVWAVVIVAFFINWFSSGWKVFPFRFGYCRSAR